MPTLQLQSGPRAGERLPVLGERFVLGRAAGCDAIINDALAGVQPLRADSVSRRHARLTFAGGHWYIEDGNGSGRASRNGTYVNDQRVPVPGRVRLRDQDRIRICDVRFTFHLDPDTTFDVEASVGHADSGSCLDAQPADRLRVLLDVSIALRGTLDIDAVLDRTLEHLFLLFPRAERGLVVFQDDAAGLPVVRGTAHPARRAGGQGVQHQRRPPLPGERGGGARQRPAGPVPRQRERRRAAGPVAHVRPAVERGGAGARRDPTGHAGRRAEVHPGRPAAPPGGRQPGVGGAQQRPAAPRVADRPAADAQPGGRAAGAARLLPHSLPAVPGYRFFATTRRRRRSAATTTTSSRCPAGGRRCCSATWPGTASPRRW